MDSRDVGEDFGTCAKSTANGADLGQDGLARYRQDLAALELPIEQETELLSILWEIMRALVDLGFDVKNCGQIVENLNLAAQADSAAIDSTDPTISEKRASPNGKTKRHE